MSDMIQAAEAALAAVEPVKELPIADPKRDLYAGISATPFAPEVGAALMAALDETDVEIRPDGLIYLPEIKYRRRLNKAFGPGGWGMMPRGPFTMQDNTMMREYAMYVGGRFVAQAVGEQDYIPNNPEMTYATASEGCRSNAIMRCCKDLGIASELWDPNFIEQWKDRYAVQVWRKAKANGKPNKPQWRRKDRKPFFDETGLVRPQAPVDALPGEDMLAAPPVSGEQTVPTPVDGNQEEPTIIIPTPERQEDGSEVLDVVIVNVARSNGRGICFKPADAKGQPIAGIKEQWLNTFHKGCFDELAGSIGRHRVIRTKANSKGFTNIEEVIG